MGCRIFKVIRPLLGPHVFLYPQHFRCQLCRFRHFPGPVADAIAGPIQNSGPPDNLEGQSDLVRYGLFHLLQFKRRNGGILATDAALDSDISIYGECGDQNLNYFNGTDVVAFGGKIHGIATWGPLSLDNLTLEGQLPIESDLQNIFSGGNNFLPWDAATPQISWFGSLKARIKAVSITFAITNNVDDFTFNRVTSQNSALSFSGSFGPGRELEYSQIPLQAASYSQPGFLITISTEF